MAKKMNVKYLRRMGTIWVDKRAKNRMYRKILKFQRSCGNYAVAPALGVEIRAKYHRITYEEIKAAYDKLTKIANTDNLEHRLAQLRAFANEVNRISNASWVETEDMRAAMMADAQKRWANLPDYSKDASDSVAFWASQHVQPMVITEAMKQDSHYNIMQRLLQEKPMLVTFDYSKQPSAIPTSKFLELADRIAGKKKELDTEKLPHDHPTKFERALNSFRLKGIAVDWFCGDDGSEVEQGRS